MTRKDSSKNGSYGIFVKDIDYNKIDYDKPLILVHDAEAEIEEIQEFISNIEIPEGVNHVHISKLKIEECKNYSEVMFH